MNAVKKLWHLNRMGRIEGAPMAGVLVAVGAVLSGGSLSWQVALAAFAMAAVTMNYVYLVNGVTDVEEDRINSPDRPLSTGAVTVSEGWAYVNTLLAIGVVYPFFLHPTWSQRVMVWALLAMGYLYSVPPVRFKRWPPLATLYLVVNFNLPIVLGHQVAGGAEALPPYLFATVALFLANMPLKDIGDSEGDAQVGLANWSNWLGQPGLLWMSSGLSLAGALATFVVLEDLGPMRWGLTLLVLLPAANVVSHVLIGLDRKELFTRGVRGLILVCMVLIVVMSVR